MVMDRFSGGHRVTQVQLCELQFVFSNTKTTCKHVFDRTAAGDVLLGTKDEQEIVR